MIEKYEAILAGTTMMHDTIAGIYEALMDDDETEALSLVIQQIEMLEVLKESLTK